MKCAAGPRSFEHRTLDRVRSLSARRSGQRVGFTLLEVILAIGLMTVLLAALYQTLATHIRAQEQTTADLRRTARARSLLHRIADDIRATPILNHPGIGDVPLARRLLNIGQADGAMADPFGQPNPTDDREVLASAESYALLGAAQRLVLRSKVNVSPRPRPATLEAGGALDSSAQEELRPRSAWRQIVYALRRPPLAPKTESTDIADGQEIKPANGTEELDQPPVPPATMLRLEVVHPMALTATSQARASLEAWLAVDVASAAIAGSVPAATPQSPANALTPAAAEIEVVRQLELADDVVDFRIRYSSGVGWSDRWDDARRLPAAVEIAIRLVDDVEDTPPEDDFLPRQPLEAAPLPTKANDFEAMLGRRWFSHRLVIALPGATPKVIATTRVEGSGETP